MTMGVKLQSLIIQRGELYKLFFKMSELYITCNNGVIKSPFHAFNCFFPCWCPYNKLHKEKLSNELDQLKETIAVNQDQIKQTLGL